MKKYYPLILVELYLCLTLLIFYFGPVEFRIHNPELFLILMFSYHLSFILGYLIFTKTFNGYGLLFQNKLNDRFFYSVFFFGLIGVLTTYQNMMMSSSLIPYNIIAEVTRGISEPGLAYTERMLNNPYSGGGDSGSRIMNILSIFYAFNKLLFIFVFLYYWSVLTYFKKILVIIYSLLFIASGIASGTNSVIFIFFIFVSFAFLVITYIKNPKIIPRIMLIFIILFLIPIGSFGYIMSQRGGGFEYFIGTSPLGDIDINLTTPDINNFFDFYSYAFVWLDYYLVQGYYGFSLIIDLDWQWTYGFGNSEFLQRQFLMLTGIDFSVDTFQYRINDIWDKTAQWHSFYGQFANDFSVVGLSILMFILGGLLARTWLSAIYNNNFFGMALLPIFILMFIFFPANNQVFGYIDTFSYFIFVTIFWYLKGKKIVLSS